VDEKRIELEEPKLVSMRPKERTDAARLLAALIRAAQRSREAPTDPLQNPDNDASALPLARSPNGNADDREAAGGAR
jgi:hypothetical protein